VARTKTKLVPVKIRATRSSYPVEGGSCNDYDYVCGDPVNGLDLAGTNKCEVGLNPLRWGGNAADCVSDVAEVVDDYANGSNDPDNPLVRGAQALDNKVTGAASAINRNVFTCSNTSFTKAATGAVSVIPPFGAGSGVKEWAVNAAGTMNIVAGALVGAAASGSLGGAPMTGLKGTVVRGGGRLSTWITIAATGYDLARRAVCRGR